MPAVKPTKSHLVAPALLFQPKPSFRLVEPKSQRSKFMFSDLALRKLKRPPKGQQVTYHDSVQRGLSLLVISTGAKTFRSRYTYGEDANGKPLHRTRSIGRFGENTLENGLDVSVRAAREIVRQDRTAAALGVDPKRRAVTGTKAALTVRQAIEMFMEDCRSWQRTWNQTQGWLYRTCADWLDRPVEGVNAGAILHRRAGAKIHHHGKQEGPRYRGPSCFRVSIWRCGVRDSL